MGMCGQELGGVAKVCRFQPSGWQVLVSCSAACVSDNAEEEEGQRWEGRVGGEARSEHAGVALCSKMVTWCCERRQAWW